jgi:hypothetical protein
MVDCVPTSNIKLAHVLYFGGYNLFTSRELSPVRLERKDICEYQREAKHAA